MSNKYLDYNGVLYFWQKIKATFAKASHTHTTADVTGLDAALTNANKVTDVKVNGTSVVTNKSANITVDSTLSTTSNNPIKNSTVAAKFNSVDSAISGKQDKLTFDSTPTENSTNPVTSGGVAEALTQINDYFASIFDAKQDKIANADKLSIDSSGIIAAKNLPSYVDDVVEVYILADGSVSAGQNGWLYTEGASSYDVLSNEKGKIYVVVGKIADVAVSVGSATDAGEYQNTQWRWTGSQYVRLTDGSGVSPITNSEIDAIVAQ